KGVPIRIAIGSRDLENNTLEIARRDTLTKETIDLNEVAIEDKIPGLLEEIQQNIYKKAYDFTVQKTTEVDSWDEFQEMLENKGGFISAHWDGTSETEERIKEMTKATIRCIPLDQQQEEGQCILSRSEERRVGEEWRWRG